MTHESLATHLNCVAVTAGFGSPTAALALYPEYVHLVERLDRYLTFLLDTPFSQSIAALLAGGGEVRYALVDVMDGSRHLCALACLVGDDRPYVTACTPAAGAGFVAHLARCTGRSPLVDVAVSVPEPDALTSIITYLVSDESVVETCLGTARA
jgi:hypothetical protein